MAKLDEVLAGLDGNARILFLANALMDEVERQGYDTKAHGCDLKCVEIVQYPDWPGRFPGTPDLRVRTNIGEDDWHVDGFRCKES